MSNALPEFLAHAIAMEHEAADRYLELADMMKAHRNDAVSKVFRDRCRFSELHRASIRARVGAIELRELQRLASDFAAEEKEHVLALDQWLAQTPRPSTPFAEDPGALEPV